MVPKCWFWPLVAFLAVPVFGDSQATQTITITVLPLVSLSVPAGADLTLQAAVAGRPGDYQPVRLVQRGGLRLFHNLASPRRILAEALLAGVASDLSLSCETPGEAPAFLVRAGQGAGPQPITPPLPAGRHDCDLIWQASATGSGTAPGQYECHIRFTVTE